MPQAYYAGHSFGWMNKFLNAIPKKQRLKRSIAFGIASCIHHQFIYTKQSLFKLSHKTLNSFGVNRRYLEPYLSLFQEAGLIKYYTEKGKSPIIHLLLRPTNSYIITNDKLNKYIIKGTGVLQSTGCLYSKVQVGHGLSKEGKQGKQAREVREVSKVAKARKVSN